MELKNKFPVVNELSNRFECDPIQKCILKRPFRPVYRARLQVPTLRTLPKEQAFH